MSNNTFNHQIFLNLSTQFVNDFFRPLSKTKSETLSLNIPSIDLTAYNYETHPELIKLTALLINKIRKYKKYSDLIQNNQLNDYLDLKFSISEKMIKINKINLEYFWDKIERFKQPIKMPLYYNEPIEMPSRIECIGMKLYDDIDLNILKIGDKIKETKLNSTDKLNSNQNECPIKTLNNLENKNITDNKMIEDNLIVENKVEPKNICNLKEDIKVSNPPKEEVKEQEYSLKEDFLHKLQSNPISIPHNNPFNVQNINSNLFDNLNNSTNNNKPSTENNVSPSSALSKLANKMNSKFQK